MQQANTHKAFAGSSLYLFAAKLFPAMAIVCTTILLSHRLSPDAYGHYQNLWIQLLPLAALASAGIPVASFSYTPAFLYGIFMQLQARHKLAYIGFILAVALLFGLLQYYYNGLSLLLPALFLFLYTATAVTEALLLVSKHFLPVTAVNILYAILFFGWHYYVLNEGYNLHVLLEGLVLLQGIRLLISGVWLRDRFRHYRHNTIVIREEQSRAAKKLWLQMGLNDMIQVSFRWIDKFVLSLFLIKATLALYSNATIDLPFLPLLFTAVSTAALQHWAHDAGREKNATMQINTLHYSARVLSAVVFPLFFFLLCFGGPFLYVVFSPVYVPALPIFICAQFMLPLRAFPFTALLQQQQRGDIINKGALADLLIAVLLMYPLYLLFGLAGVALSTVISTWWQAGYYLYHSGKLLQVSPFSLLPLRHLSGKALLFALLFGGCRIAGHLLRFQPEGLFILAAIVLGISCIVALWQAWRTGADFFRS